MVFSLLPLHIGPYVTSMESEMVTVLPKFCCKIQKTKKVVYIMKTSKLRYSRSCGELALWKKNYSKIDTNLDRALFFFNRHSVDLFLDFIHIFRRLMIILAQNKVQSTLA